MSEIWNNLHKLTSEANVAALLTAVVSRATVIAQQSLSDIAGAPGWDPVPGLDLESIFQQAVRTTLAAMATQAVPGELEKEAIDTFVRAEVAGRGFTGAMWLVGQPLLFRNVWIEASRVTEDLGLPGEALTEAGSRMLAWWTTITAIGAQIFAEIEAETAHAADVRRSRFLRDLFASALDEEELRTGALAHGLVLDGEYIAIRARVVDGQDSELRRLLSRLGGVIGTVDDDLAGLVMREPRDVDGAVIGLGPASPLASAGASYRLASRAFDTALAFGLRGRIRLEDLGVLAAVHEDAAVSERLVDRYVHKVHESSRSGVAILASVEAYLDHGLRIDPAADALHVHQNTLRYRLKRFGEITETDLSETRDIVEVWWAFQRWRSRRDKWH